jgi:hypothetical protein
MATEYLDSHVFFISLIEKYIDVKQILRVIEDELVEGLKEDPTGLDYITWGEFESYFQLLRKVTVPSREIHYADHQRF